MRILQVVGAMNRGGVETWLMHVLRYLRREDYEIDFLVHTSHPAVFDDEILMRGSRVLRCPHTQNPIKYAWVLYRLLKSGNYDVIHSHVHGFSGVVLFVAAMAGVPIRIAHSHSDTRAGSVGENAFRKVYKRMMRLLIEKFATVGVAVSANAAYSLYGDKWEKNKKYKIMYCGVDLSPFNERVSVGSLRSELGVHDDEFVIGHVGRMETPKNHKFLIDVFKQVLVLNENCKLLMVGDGSLREEIENYAVAVGVSKKIIYAGLRGDVPNLMVSAMNVFLFPSRWEGLPLTLIEAQAAGLRCIVSDAVTQEVSVSSCTYLSLDEGVEVWARVAVSELELGRVSNGYDLVLNSVFSIDASVQELLRLYDNHSSI